MRRKIVLSVLASFLLLITISGLLVLWWVRSGRLDLWLQNQIIHELAQVGATAKIEHTRLGIRGSTVTLRGLTLYSLDSHDPFASIEEIHARFSITDYFRQNVRLEELIVTRPQVWVRFNEQGHSNLSTLHLPEEKKTGRREVAFESARFSIKEGNIFYTDTAHRVDGQVKNFQAAISPTTDGWFPGQFLLAFKNSNLSFDGRKVEAIDVKLQARVNEKGALIDSLEIASPLAEAKLDGQLDDWEKFYYRLNAYANINLGAAASIFAPASGLAGTAIFKGRVDGEGTSYRIDGSVESKNLAAAGIRISGFALSGGLDGHALDLSFDSQIRWDRLTAASLRGIPLGGFRGYLRGNNESAILTQFTANLFGGEARGAATIQFERGERRSSAEVTLSNLKLERIAALISQKQVSIIGTADAMLKLAWPGLNFEVVSGVVTSRFSGQALPAQEGASATPFEGEVDLTARRGEVDVQRGHVISAASEFLVKGHISNLKTVSLDVEFASRDMARINQILKDFALLPQEAQRSFNFSMGGPGSFKGRVEGPFNNPQVSGRAQLETVTVRGEHIGRFVGDLFYGENALRLDNALIARPDGSRASLSLFAPLEDKDAVSIDATLHNLSLPFIVKVAAPEEAEKIAPLEGAISGKVQLSGLSATADLRGLAKMRGFVDIRATNGQIRGNRFDEAAGHIAFSENKVEFNNVSVRSPMGAISGSGRLNTRTESYQLNARATNLDLSQLAEGKMNQGLKLTGFINLELAGAGKLNELQFDLKLQGRDVAIGDEKVTDLRLTIRAADNNADVNGTIGFLNSVQTITGKIDLSDQDNLPIDVHTNLRDAPIAPYISLVTKSPSNIEGVASGLVHLHGPLLGAENLHIKAELNSVKPVLKFDSESSGYPLTNEGPVTFTLTPQQISFAPFKLKGDGTNLSVSGAIAIGGEARNSLDINGEVNLRVIGSLVKELYAGGLARLKISVGGTGGNPRLTGAADIQDASLRSINFPISIQEGTGRIIFTTNQAQIQSFTARAEGGRLNVTGGVIFAGLRPERWRFEAKADQVRALYPADVRSVFDGELILQGNQKVQVLTGTVLIRRAEYTKDVDFTEMLLSREAPTGAEPAFGSSVRLDVKVDARDTLVVRNNLTDAVGSASLQLRGPINDPIISGRATVTRGTLQFRNDQYQITRGIIEFPGLRTAEPSFNIQAESDIRGYRIVVGFNGTLRKFNTVLRSEPALPTSDVIALITTGDLAPAANGGQVGAQSSVGLAASLLSESISRTIERRTNRLFGLSRFQIDPLFAGRSSNPGARITLGRQLTKNITVLYSVNVAETEQQVVIIEYRLSDRISFVGVRDQEGEFGFDVRFKKRF